MDTEIELLSPAGDFDCLKAAVQNGADCIYFGASSFSARASAKNFDEFALQEAISYCKIRGVKTNLTLNTLIKDNEFEDAFNLAKKAYEFGIDAIIVQDFGLARLLIKKFPDLPIHASTQMSVHNLQGALKLQNLGFSRIVLARELSIDEIEYICQNTDVEIECFIHGALCISYSGQCLFSSLIGGRSGNRGTCAQGCRLPYELVENNESIEKGYLLSPRDLCSLDFLPRLVNSGVKSFKIEGRMKPPEYVATVTRIYRKYINMIKSGEKYEIDEKDKKDLLQVFNRGNFSSGHLSSDPNHNLIFPKKPNNMGIQIGSIAKFNLSKGLISLSSSEPLSIGDTIKVEGENNIYTISELMKNSQNIKTSNPNDFVTIGRMKGNIKNGLKVYKMSSKELITNSLESFKNDKLLKQIPLNCEIKVVKNIPLSIHITSANDLEIYKKLDIYYESDCIPTDSINHPLEKEKIIEQISKTNNTPYYFKNIKIKLDSNLFLPSIKALNELRRTSLKLVEDFAKSNIQRKSKITLETCNYNIKNKETTISVLLNKIDLKQNYNLLYGIDNIYIPLSIISKKEYENIIGSLCQKFNIYIYLPIIIKPNYRNMLASIIEEAIKKYNVKGFILSNISNFTFLEQFNSKQFEFIANYTFNVFNKYTMKELKNLGINKFTISPELDKNTITEFAKNTDQELICYGRTPLMSMNYCPLGKSNKCYPICDQKCMSNNDYYLKDRLNFKFPILPDNTQTVTTLYNSKITSIATDSFDTDFSIRIDILEENVNQIQEIINIVKSGNRIEGQDYTNGNLNRIV